MVGPLSSEEIEDVVSSVRRLVSNELHSRTLSRDVNADRLILTAALRVVPETSPLAPLVLDAPVVESRQGHDAVAGDREAERVMDEPVAEPDTPDAADKTAEAPMALDVPSSPAAEDEPDLTPAFLVEPPVPDPVAEIRPVPETGATEAAAPADLQPDEAVIADDPVQQVVPASEEPGWEDDIWPEPDAASLGEVALAAEEAEVLTGPAESDLPDAGDADASPVPDGEEEAGLPASADGPVPFVPLRRRADQLAAQAAPDELPSPRPPSVELVTAPDAAQTADVTEFVDADGTPLAVLDEAALQEIVRQTLRAELQGDLGERITRNIRKLVRAEINRAFIARDLD